MSETHASYQQVHTGRNDIHRLADPSPPILHTEHAAEAAHSHASHPHSHATHSHPHATCPPWHTTPTCDRRPIFAGCGQNYVSVDELRPCVSVRANMSIDMKRCDIRRSDGLRSLSRWTGKLSTGRLHIPGRMSAGPLCVAIDNDIRYRIRP